MSTTQPDNERSSTACPIYGFNSSLKIARAVKELGGAQADVPKSLLAQQVKVKEGAMLSQMIGAAKAFGLIRGFKTYRLTQEAERIFLPTSDGDAREATLICFATPAAYRAVIDRFDGTELPAAPMLGNLLLREKLVSQSWAHRVASMIHTAVSDLGIIDGSGIMRYHAAIHSARSNAMPATQSQRRNSPQIITPEPQAAHHKQQSDEPFTKSQLMTHCNTWSFTESGHSVKLETPTDGLPMPLWEKLRKYIDVLKPSDESKKGS